jgi:hypothetical protein
MLVEQGVADLPARLATEVRHHPVEVGVGSEDVWAEPPNRPRGQLEHRPVPEHSLVLHAAQHEPRSPQERRPAGKDAPAASHTQMAAQHHPALEAKEEVLPGGLDGQQQPAVDLLGHARRRSPGMRALRLETLADEHLQSPRGPVEGIALGHGGEATRQRSGRVYPPGMAASSRARAAIAGAAAATAWGLLEPIDRRIFRCDYSDVAVLGKLVTRGRHWRAAGFSVHAANGAAFGLVYDELRRRRPGSRAELAVTLALAEHVTLYPLCWFVDRFHPARGEDGIPPLLTNPRAYAQATVRHLVFGAVLARLV